MQPGEKDSIADSKVGVTSYVVRWSCHLTVLKNMDVYRSGGGKNYKRIHVRKLKNCFTHYDICISVDFDFIV